MRQADRLAALAEQVDHRVQPSSSLLADRVPSMRAVFESLRMPDEARCRVTDLAPGTAAASSAYDTLKVQVRNSGGTILATPATYSNLDKASSHTQRSVDLSAYKGQTVQVFFTGAKDASLQTTFLVDDVALTVP